MSEMERRTAISASAMICVLRQVEAPQLNDMGRADMFKAAVYSPGGFFAGASNFQVNGPVNMVQSFESGNAVIQRLADEGAPAAMHNSSSRAYAPRCHADTRKTFRNDLVEWSTDPKNQARMRWYMGPAGIGKSAIAQSVAEASEDGSLGAAFFFSRSAQVDDADTVFQTLAYQLAMKNTEYKTIISHQLGQDPLLFTKNRRTLFKQLIAEPFRILTNRNESIVDGPFLIILDGLDECKDAKAQCDLVEIISDYVRRVEKSPLLWAIFSRPEWHLKSISSDPNLPTPCAHIDISVDEEEAQRDVRRLLEDGFVKIKQKFDLSSTWPRKEQVDLIATAASGHLGFASFILRFIDDENGDDNETPEQKLKLCIKVIQGLGVDPGSLNPLEALDNLYLEILSTVPPSVLPMTMRILGLFIMYPCISNRYTRASPEDLSVEDQAAFLAIDKSAYKTALRRLYSVLYFHTASEGQPEILRLYHTSFADFLRDSLRSRQFCLDGGAIHLDVATQGLHLLHDVVEMTMFEAFFDPKPALHRYALQETWEACCHVPESLLSQLILKLEHFNFKRMKTQNWDESFARFIRRLYFEARNNELIQVTIVSKPLDDDVIFAGLRDFQNLRDFSMAFPPRYHVARPLDELHFILKTTTQTVSITLLTADLEEDDNDDNDGEFDINQAYDDFYNEFVERHVGPLQMDDTEE
ncbi:hypothetical protein AN958_09444 [Leucoagaricus sp. SymC.cos]|nr:hypothetical protein AN958_09444 [Leucoagaricus sp. SymC.cos]